MPGNETLRNANRAKKDEFYTQLTDIEKEIKNYKDYFENKIVLCNCDDPYESDFFKYFALNFNRLKLKKLISISYASSPIVGTELNLFEYQNKEYKINNKKAYKVVMSEFKDLNNDGREDLLDIYEIIKHRIRYLEDDGDFRSEESLAILKEADIVVTNPPFSLFREYISKLIENNKKFIIIGNTNALTYKEVFKLFKEDKIRTGYTNFNVGMYFFVPEYSNKFHKIINGRKAVRVATSCWFTNLPVKKHAEDLVLFKNYSKELYPKYENFNAININKYTDIPCDYNGYMGVPITFLDKYNPEQFELIGLGISSSGLEIGVSPYKEEHKIYRKTVQNKGAVDGDLYMLDANGNPVVPYARIIIKKKR